MIGALSSASRNSIGGATIGKKIVSSPGPDVDALMPRALDGDVAAYRCLLENLRARLMAYVGRRLRADPAQVEDLVQDILVAIHTRRATFDRTQPVTAWVYAIARHKLVDHYRRLGRRPDLPLEMAGHLAVDDGSGPVDARSDLVRGLAELSERTRDLVVSVKLGGIRSPTWRADTACRRAP